jgi:UDP-GlcNAc:undecaprenyl-phosphate GlcNAc-1-phosphate transferase
MNKFYTIEFVIHSILNLQIDQIYIYSIVFVILILLLYCYFKIAETFNIVDKPNHRSSHNTITIRGGGVIFPLSLFAFPFFFSLNYPYFLIGLFMISLVSFFDDVKPVSNVLRITVHLLATVVLILQLGILTVPIYMLLLFLFIAIGTINAVNFMDGINGMIGGYSLITLVTLWYVNENIAIHFTSSSFILMSILSVVVFNIFNFRNKSICFAGDVGSISIAFILIFFIGQLIHRTGDFSYILLLLLFGLDTVSTILSRILKREAVFDPHRSHYYQYLVNQRSIPHVYVSLGYSLIQVIFNFLLIKFLIGSATFVLVFCLIISSLFLMLRFKTEGKTNLLGI